MQTRHSFSVDFIIRKCRENKKRALIYARITVDGERKEISLKESIDASAWDNKGECIKGKGASVKSLNEYIEEVRFKIKSKYRLLHENNALITAETVKQAYLGEHTAQKGHKLTELLDYFQKIWEGKSKEGTFKNYRTTIQYIKLFVVQLRASGDLYLSEINMQFATDLEYYIRNKPVKEHDPCAGNGVAKHIQRFKRIMKWAVDEINWLKVNPVTSYSCPIKSTRRKKLSIQELVALEAQTFADETIRYVNDLFLFSCYTGLAFVDVMQLHTSHFEWETNGTVWCKVYRTKSEELSPVPLLASAKNILKRFQKDDINAGTFIFPRVTNQHVNRSLKIIQAICNIETPMTFHVARHTFAKTVALKNGIPLETVQMMMGHTKITTTQIYADVDEEKIIGDMAGLEDKLNSKREIIKSKLLVTS